MTGARLRPPHRGFSAMVKRFCALAALALLLAMPATSMAAHPHVRTVRLLVQFSHEAGKPARADALEHADARVKRRIPQLDTVSVTVARAQMKRTIGRLQGSGAVASVQQD